MNKKTYLNKLFNYLLEKDVSKKDIDTIISDYSEIYDEAKALDFSDEEVAEKLGKPSEIYHAIKDTLHYNKNTNGNKIVAIMPFIATILFFTFGFVLDAWSYGWMFYLLIPVIAIIVNVRGKDKLVAISPFVSVITFFILGFGFDIWHPSWMIFLLVPILAILLNTPGRSKIVALLPFVVLLAYILIGSYVDPEFFLYGWASFALVPMLALILFYDGFKSIILLLSILLAVGAHLAIYFMMDDITIAWLPYLLPVAIGITFGYVTILPYTYIKTNKWVVLAMLLVITAYLLVSFLVQDIWTWSWIILLFIPMFAIYQSEKFKHPVAYMPFICVAAFMLLGMLGDFWQFAWIVFLLIPITAILTESGNDDKNSLNDESSDV